MAACVGGRSQRKSAVQNNTESRFSSWVLKRIEQKMIRKNCPEKNTSFVVFYAILGLQSGPQNSPNDQKNPFQRLLTAQSAVKINTESEISSSVIKNIQQKESKTWAPE